MKKNSAINLTPGEGNYFFGFHDLVAWNAAGDKLAALRIDDISTPPHPNKACDIGYVKESVFTKLGTTHAYNYPQGARQQWIGDTDLLIVNDKINKEWRSKVYDTSTGKEISSLKYPTHVITDDGWAFGIDYARLHRVGGYGYTGLPDKTRDTDAPTDTGIVKHNVYTGEYSLLVSINQVANFEASVSAGRHHYITHLLLNPAQNRIAFLHRCKLRDGGETTRLMTIGIDGTGMRCLGTGFLSHFDWKDDNHIAIWGRTGSGVEKLRNSLLYKMMPSGLIVYGKKIIKKLLYKNKPSSQGTSLFNWLVLSDDAESTRSFLAKDIITEDGHPMFCPANRDWLVADNYPDGDGVRTLFLFQYSTQNKVDLGAYKMIDTKPDLKQIAETLEDVEASVLKSFEIKNMAFYRSGYHCDLHPRWKRDGTMVAFDSIHDGKRNIYGFDVRNIINNAISD